MLIHGGKDFDGVQDLFIELSFFVGTLFDDLTKNGAIQFVEFARSLTNDSSSSRSIIHQGQFSKGLPVSIGL